MSSFYGPLAYYTNGSLYPQVTSVNSSENISNFYAYDPYSFNNIDPQVNLTIFPNDILELSFAVGNGNLSSAFPLLLMLLNPNSTQVDVLCSYPLSGQYDRLQRYLFYGTLIVALLFRRNSLIAIAAIGVTMTYSALAAIHLFILLAWFKFGDPAGYSPLSWNKDTSKAYGDIDYYGIFPIITATVVMIAPLLTWSSTIRTHEARIVMVYWAVLIFAATIPTIFLWDKDFNLDIFGSVAYCTGTGDKCSWNNLENYLDSELYQSCNCVDFCGLLSPNAALRTQQNMVAYIGLGRSQNDLNNNGNALVSTYNTIFIIWIFALAQGFLAILSIQSGPVHARNQIFKIFNADIATIVGYFFKGERRNHILQKLNIQDPKSQLNDTIYRKIRRNIARIVATLYFGLTIIGGLLYPLVFVATIIVNEIFVNVYPVSETSSAIGAWSPMVAAALVILASLIVRFHTPLIQKSARTIKKPLRQLSWGPNDRPENSLLDNKDGSSTRNELLKYPSIFFHHLGYLIHFRFWRLQIQSKLFKEWWNDPETHSDPTRWASLLNYNIQNVSDSLTFEDVSNYRWAMEQGEPECRCRSCSTDVFSTHEIMVEQK
jgi:hypothetical protein